MLTKAVALGCAAVSAPLFITASTQDPVRPAPAPEVNATLTTTVPAPAIKPASAETERLRRAIRRAEQRATTAETRTHELDRQLGEALDLLEQSTRTRHRNCSPSRGLLTYYQWMQKNGHDERADKMLTRVIEGVGDDTNRLNSLAWSLMTDKDTAGKYDKVALALAERMQKKNSRRLQHNHLDTIALAHFLGGKIDEAITLQKKAIERGGRSSDYRRRLRMFEAAKGFAPLQERVEHLAGGDGGGH